MASLGILYSNLFNLKNKVTKVDHKKIFGPSIDKYFMAYQYMPKIFNDPPQNISAPSPSYILNVRSLNWKSQFFFITKHINTNDVFCFNFAKIFFSNRKPNPIIIKIINKFFIFPCNSFCMYFYWTNVPNMAS